MKATILFASFLFLGLASHAQKENERWSIGLKTGFVTEFNTLKGTQLNTTNENVAQTSIHNQLFVNKSFGKKQKWMLDASVAYFSNSITERLSSYPSFPLTPTPYQNNYKNKNISFQITGRYLVYSIKPLQWKHYVGISINPIKTISTYKGYYIDNFDQRSTTRNQYDDWHTYLGIEYFGKINLNSRISVQYNVNYGLSDPSFDVTSSIMVTSENSTLHKINVGFGLGWGF